MQSSSITFFITLLCLYLTGCAGLPKKTGTAPQCVTQCAIPSEPSTICDTNQTVQDNMRYDSLECSRLSTSVRPSQSAFSLSAHGDYVEQLPSILTGTLFEQRTPNSNPSFQSRNNPNTLQQSLFDPPRLPNDDVTSLLPNETIANNWWQGYGSPERFIPDLKDKSPDDSQGGFHFLIQDQRNFYSCQSLTWLAVGVGGAAVMANTSVDRQFERFYDIHFGSADNDLNAGKDLGDGLFVLPTLAGIWLIDYCIVATTNSDSNSCAAVLEQWSERSLRGFLVGAGPMLALQWTTGGSRPGESNVGSDWKFLQDNNGVSGHAFIGAVPFFTAAKMSDDLLWKIGFYTMGSAAGISRIHDDAHYLSQVTLGWWLAYLSVVAVDRTEMQKRNWELTPTIVGGAPGVAVLRQW